MEHAAQEAQRPRANTHFSFRSDKSNELQPTKSRQSKHERKVSESEKRKTHYDPSTKANPNAAMNEAQPIAAALEKPTLQSLRSFQHKDSQGNDIVDPDLSNPTRSRWERPLDTIKSFEAAIDGEYRRRAQSMRADQTDVMSGYNSRRSSYYGGHEQNRYSRASYYGHRQPGRDSNYENGDGFGGPVGGPQRMRYGNRMQSDPGWNNRQSSYNSPHNVYPMNGLQQSRDTVNTNGSNGSHSDGPYSNDPSSDNSSFERAVPVQRPQPPPQQDLGQQYGFNGFGQGPQMDQYGQGPSGGNGYFPPPQNNMQNGPPPPPKHAAQAAPIRLNGSGASPPADTGRGKVLTKNGGGGDDKRKSWFKRRFSKD
ncbi:hypothetical protein FB567DRAFT_60170 [Paraphoma chrysanthemicola]|uniref:DUF2406 domain-containing protein n=1 Tax=Paraphoma chrysanthemicola TaxID=798071 RepID=A0A8K0R858_9PLEO|nr:hypothetical protein FB567DRAFT_60170 [Paraphoma chrysanthemicola]